MQWSEDTGHWTEWKRFQMDNDCRHSTLHSSNRRYHITINCCWTRSTGFWANERYPNQNKLLQYRVTQHRQTDSSNINSTNLSADLACRRGQENDGYVGKSQICYISVFTHLPNLICGVGYLPDVIICFKFSISRLKDFDSMRVEFGERGRHYHPAERHALLYIPWLYFIVL